MSDELNPTARAFLHSVEDADDPTRADYDRVHAKVKVRLAAGIAAGVAALTTSKAAAATAKAAAATAAATGSVAPPAAAIATAGTGAAIAGKIVAVVAVVAAVGGGTTAVVHYANRAATTAPVPTASAAPVVAQAPPARPAPKPSAATTAIAAPETTAAAPVASSTARIELPRAPAPSVVVPPAAPTATGVVTASSLDAEIALVRDARAALRGGDAARSVALLDEHDRRFPGGALAEDCAAERIYALCAMGNVDGARSAAARFLADHPYSPHAASVRASCGVATGMN
jgi:hypothetical protein